MFAASVRELSPAGLGAAQTRCCLRELTALKTGEQGAKKQRDLFKVTQLVGGRARN